MISEGFPGRPVVENLLANAGDMGLISGPGRSQPQGNCCAATTEAEFPRACALQQDKPPR